MKFEHRANQKKSLFCRTSRFRCVSPLMWASGAGHTKPSSSKTKSRKSKQWTLLQQHQKEKKIFPWFCLIYRIKNIKERSSRNEWEGDCWKGNLSGFLINTLQARWRCVAVVRVKFKASGKLLKGHDGNVHFITLQFQLLSTSNVQISNFLNLHVGK